MASGNELVTYVSVCTPSCIPLHFLAIRSGGDDGDDDDDDDVPKETRQRVGTFAST